MFQTDKDERLMAETVTFAGFNGEIINAFYARPSGGGPFPSMVLAHHMPGWDEWYKLTTLKFAYYGYATLTPNLYFRAGHGTAEDVAARVRADGGVSDAQAVGDLIGAMQFLRNQPANNGKVGIFGTCSGGRHAYLTACQSDGFNAIVDCWGGRLVMPPETLNEKTPVSPLDLTKDLACPVLGLFGELDQSPTPEQVDLHEAELKRLGKPYEFYRYPDAGHGFFYQDRPNYRQAQAVDGWSKTFTFLHKHLSA